MYNYDILEGEFVIVPDYIERSKRRTLTLTVLKNGTVVVKAPLSMKDSVINKFVESKQNWIQEKLRFVNKTNDKFEDVIQYRKFLLYANEYSLLMSDVKKIEVNDSFQIVIPKKTDPAKVLKILKNWYKKIAKSVLADRICYLEDKIRLKSNMFKICDSKGKWGSCNSKGVVSLNWRVIMLPPQIIDYVIIHELCHLVEMNHSKNFWTLVSKFLPNVSELKKKIKEYGFLLGLFHN